MKYNITTVDAGNAGRLNIRNAPAGKIIGKYTRGTILEGPGETSGSWTRITAPGPSGWCSSGYVQAIAEEEPVTQPADKPAEPPKDPDTDRVDASENEDQIWESGKTITGTSNRDYNILYERYIRSFGCPPRFSDKVDIPYTNSITEGIGRVYAKAIFSHPSLLSICPGGVDYLPGFSKQEKSTFLKRVVGMADGTLGTRIKSEQDNPFTSGKLFEFKQDFTGYIKNVNVLARSISLFLGIGDEKMPGTSIKLKHFDYGWWFSRKHAKSDPQDRSIFGQAFAATEQITSSAIGDDAYIHCFIMGQGSTVSEDISTQTEASQLEQIINGSGLDSLFRNLNFLFGSDKQGMDPSSDKESAMMKDLDAALSGSPGFLQSFGYLAKNYLKGGRMVFPQMISGVNYSKALSCSIRCVCPNGSKMGFHLSTGVPIAFMLAMSLPKQLADNMYTYPFITRVFQQGWYNSDLAVISNLRITRGGQDDMRWTIDSLPTETEISFDVLPLYNQLMSSSSTHPFLYMKNTSMIEYLASMCGVDLKLNNLDMKVQIAGSMIRNRFSDIPTNLGRGVTEKIITAPLTKKILKTMRLLR